MKNNSNGSATTAASMIDFTVDFSVLNRIETKPASASLALKGNGKKDVVSNPLDFLGGRD